MVRPTYRPSRAEAPRAVEPGQPDAVAVEPRVAEPLQPARLAHLGVVVQEAEELAAGERAPRVERADEAHVLRVPA